jgi:hypothetical protein
MQPDSELICTLLRKLVEIEPHVADGAVIHTHDDQEGLRAPDPLIVEGYEGRGHAVNEHLKMLVRRGFVEGTENTGLAIFFKRVTAQGRAHLAECEA